jgi:hypothetical protein
MNLALRPIDQSLVVYHPGTPNSLQTYSDAMGNAGTAADGFEQAFGLLMSLLPSGDSQLSDMEGVTGDLLTALESGSNINADGILSAWLGGLPAINQLQATVDLRTFGPLSIPNVNIPITTTTPPAQPCPPATHPPIHPHPTPIPLPHPPICLPAPCPSGYVPSPRGGCEPAGPPPDRPPVVPPIGVPGTPNYGCPPGFVSTPMGDCYPIGAGPPGPLPLPGPTGVTICDPFELELCPPEPGQVDCFSYDVMSCTQSDSGAYIPPDTPDLPLP